MSTAKQKAAISPKAWPMPQNAKGALKAQIIQPTSAPAVPKSVGPTAPEVKVLKATERAAVPESAPDSALTIACTASERKKLVAVRPVASADGVKIAMQQHFKRAINAWTSGKTATSAPLRLPIMTLIDASVLDSWEKSLTDAGYTVSKDARIFTVAD